MSPYFSEDADLWRGGGGGEFVECFGRQTQNGFGFVVPIDAGNVHEIARRLIAHPKFGFDPPKEPAVTEAGILAGSIPIQQLQKAPECEMIEPLKGDRCQPATPSRGCSIAAPYQAMWGRLLGVREAPPSLMDRRDYVTDFS